MIVVTNDEQLHKQLSREKKQVFVSGAKSTNYWLLDQILYRWTTRETWFTKFSSLYYHIQMYVSFVQGHSMGRGLGACAPPPPPGTLPQELKTYTRVK